MHCLADTDLEGQNLNWKIYGPVLGPTRKLFIGVYFCKPKGSPKFILFNDKIEEYM